VSLRPLPLGGDLVEIRAELAALRARVEHLEREQPSRLSRRDRDRLQRLLPVWAAFGSAAVLVRELAAHPSVQLVVGDLPAGRIGCLLRRAAGRSIDGFTITHAGVENNAALWQLLAVS
jgi:hypothetical protein